MDHALAIPELLIKILEYLSADELMVAALVCRAWVDPAVDTEWRTQTIMLSRLLARLAPIRKSTRGRTVLAIKSPITQDHWTRFLKHYANRITKLEFDMELDKSSVKLISTLLGRFGGEFGCNLISLMWSKKAHHNDDNRKLIDLLPGRKLREVYLRFSNYGFTTENSLHAVLSLLAYRAPRISILQAEGILASFDYSVFSQLQYLSHCGHLSTSDYHNLVHCPNLKLLRLGWTVMEATGVQQVNWSGATFLRLEDFQLSTDNDEAEDTIMRSIMPALRSLQYIRGRDLIGPFTLPLLNNIL